MPRKNLSLIIAVFLMSFLLVACQSGPSDDKAERSFSSGMESLNTKVRNVRVVNKVQCEHIPQKDKVNGTSEIWLVKFQYEIYYHYDWTSDNTLALLSLVNGSWQASVALDCPKKS